MKKYVEITAVLLFMKFCDDLGDTLPEDVRELIPERYRWGTLKALSPKGFGDGSEEVLARLDEFFSQACQPRDEHPSTVGIFEGFSLGLKHPEVLGQAMSAIDRIDFAGEDYDQAGDLHEFLISRMADAGVKGEFYTPRLIVDMVMQVMQPRAGARVWDPACGTAGFLARAFDVIRSDILDRYPAGNAQEQALARLRQDSLYGNETDPVSARLARMNMLLRGDGHTNILELNTLDRRTYESETYESKGKVRQNPLKRILGQTGPKFDVIVANPPYGGQQAVVSASEFFGPWFSTKKPESGFLQVMMNSLAEGGRCGVVLPEGVLFRREEQSIRERLLRDFELEAVVGLYRGAFEFAGVQTCVVFFRRPRATERWVGTDRVWFFNAVDQTDLETLHQHYQTEERLGRWVSTQTIHKQGLNLRPTTYLAMPDEVHSQGEEVTLGDLFEPVEDITLLEDGRLYTQLTVQYHGRGAVIRERQLGSEIGTKRQITVTAGDLVVSRIDARHGAMAIVPESLDGAIVTKDFPVFRLKNAKIKPELIPFLLRFGPLAERFTELAQGSTRRQRVTVQDILSQRLPFLSQGAQEELLPRLQAQLDIHDRAIALSAAAGSSRWLDDSYFSLGDKEAVASSLAPFVSEVTDYVEPAAEPDKIWQVYSISNTAGIYLGEHRLGRDFKPGRKYKRVVGGRIAYAVDRVNVGTVGVMPEAPPDSIISPYRTVFQCDTTTLSPDWVYFLMKAPFFQRRIREAQVGAVRNELRFRSLTQIPVQVPSLSHQQRLVEELQQVEAEAKLPAEIASRAERLLKNIVSTLFDSN
nr:N-6 DNA methylase [Micromonospora chalcea]